MDRPGGNDSTTAVNHPLWDRMVTPEQRYRNDPQYRQLVETMLAFIIRADFTPSELRQAAIYASIKYESMHIRESRLVPETGVIEHLRALEGWLDKERSSCCGV